MNKEDMQMRSTIGWMQKYHFKIDLFKLSRVIQYNGNGEG